MGHFATYIALMLASWGVRLRPRLYVPSGYSVLRLQICNITRSFLEANLYTAFTILILQMPSPMFTTHKGRNFKFLFVLPYMLQYFTCLWSTAQNIKDMLTEPELLTVKDYLPAHLKMIAILGLQLLGMIEIGFVLFYSLKKELQPVAK
ncbi:uncharacterized protein LOC108028217 [Drosophila biarmipes]|uniref:uncharacterized protein LOC108028217 n=1 Tax=Drosophila biarmipes TaxID=125945 RepID=UPI0007E86362|nr:uncharacterized protein LOC108028217 [Drosophila biarmipes]